MLQLSLPWLSLLLGAVSGLIYGERDGVDETRKRTHIRRINTNTFWQPGATILVGHLAPSGATGSCHQRQSALNRSLFTCLEGSCQTELLIPGLLFHQAVHSAAVPSNFKSSGTSTSSKHRPQRLFWSPSPKYPLLHPLRCLLCPSDLQNWGGGILLRPTSLFLKTTHLFAKPLSGFSLTSVCLSLTSPY